MRILHLCLSCFYIDGYNYQENVLPRINKEDGNDVYIIASTATYIDNKHIGYVEPSQYVTEYGVPIKRLPYIRIFNHFVSCKIRAYPNLYKEIEAVQPDVIMSHSLGYWSVLDVIKYKKQHPEVKFYADTHTAYDNSGRNWLSLNILHKMYYKWLVHRVLPYIERYFYIGEGEHVFAREIYKVPEKMMEFYPLGGDILSEEEYRARRNRVRKELGLASNELLLIHSGKMDRLKRTSDLLRAFAKVPQLKAKLVIIGSLSMDVEKEIENLIAQDKRVQYIGWKKSEELITYLCACDLYCQPGKVSAIMQNAVCCRCPLLLYPHLPYVKDYDYGNILWIKSIEDMANIFRSLAANEINLSDLSTKSEKCAKELLDYRSLAARLYR